MAVETPLRHEARTVRIGLLDGEDLRGSLRGFSPSEPDLWLEPPSAGAARQRIPAQTVVFVAFERRHEGAAAVTGMAAQATSEEPALRVHLTRGRTFMVHPTGDPRDPLGFRARPADEDADFEEIFFYRHGVNALERDESIGAMLLEGGALAREDLQRGLEQQASLRRKRIGEILIEQNSIVPEALHTALELQQRKHTRLGEVLVDAGLATREDVENALAEQRRRGGRRIGEILISMGVVDERTLALTLARKFHLPFVDLDECLFDPDALRAIPRSIIEKHRVLPIDRDHERVTIALSDPLNTEPIDLIRFHRSEKIREVVAVPAQIERYLVRMLSESESDESEHEIAALLQSIEVEARDASEEDEDPEAVAIRESDNEIIQLASQIIAEAVRRQASDIHVEPNGSHGEVRIRIRVDGECIALPGVPASRRLALVSRLKIMANLDISERRKPQDGKIRLRLPGRTVELRVATVPTTGGEDVVLRILSASKPLALDQLGLADRNRRELEQLIAKPYGLVLCVGPTGSGKTTSLHSLLGHINTAERKIWTAEDPVEITQAGLRQVQVRSKIGFGFAEALRAFLRADPDVIMVGEMRDRETAGIAIEASLTGHLVFSTLHTNSAPETVVRLIEMGLDPFSFGDALLGVLAQRLARRLCDRCRSLEPVAADDIEALRRALGPSAREDEIGQLSWRARGCGACHGTGYRGRVPIHELLVVDPTLRAAIHTRANAEQVRELALQNGMTTLLQDGARKCLAGETDLDQVLAVCTR